MEGGVAVVPPRAQPHGIPLLTVPNALSSYNISLNLSSIFAMLPGSRFLARLRRGTFDTVTPLESTTLPVASIVDEWAEASSASIGGSNPVAQTATEQLAAFPGPWGFFMSGYMLGLLIMATLLHRMQNIILPSRLPSRRSRHAYRFPPSAHSSSRYTHIVHRLYAALLPLDFSKSSTRLALHLPSIYFLSRMLLVWFLLVLQTCEIMPSLLEKQTSPWTGHLQALSEWCSKKEMSEICWSTFCAVCAAFLIEGFIKALDGIGSGFPIGNVNPNTSPFNLVGYAFLLHVYSSPIAHAYHPEDKPSRPDKHVIITIAIPLLQLTIFHILSVSKRLSTHRLLPTALTSLLSLIHFHGTLFSHFFLINSPSPTSTANPNASTTNRRRSAYMGSTTYPLLNYIPNIFETLLICTILLTVFLNVLVQLLVRGKVERVFSGLGIGPHAQDEDGNQGGFWQNLPMDEDFGVVLLRVGTASLEATGLRGWSNEVAPVRLSVPRKRGKGYLSSSHQHRHRSTLEVEPQLPPTNSFGSVTIGRIGVGEVRRGSSMVGALRTPAPSSLTNRQSKLRVKPHRGFMNEVRNVDLGSPDDANRPGGRGYGRGRSSGNWWSIWFREVKPFFIALWEVSKGLFLYLTEGLRKRRRERRKLRRLHLRLLRGEDVSDSEFEEEAEGKGEGEQGDDEGVSVAGSEETDVYERFLRGEEISDDEDDEAQVWEEGQEQEDEDTETEVHDSAAEGNEQGSEGEAEAIGLFTDFIRNGPSTVPGRISNSTGLMLVHLLYESESSRPLTRRRWSTMSRMGGDPHPRDEPSEDEDDFYDDHLTPRYQGETQDSQQGGGGMQSLCVICTTEAREIICWPCRCLAMCDHCRENMASRGSPNKHRCPCCRQTVEGYSRIYIP